jgi:hypothetical protein
MSQPQSSQSQCKLSKDNIDISTIFRTPDGGMNTCANIGKMSICFPTDKFVQSLNEGKLQIWCKDAPDKSSRVCALDQNACESAPFH